MEPIRNGPFIPESVPGYKEAVELERRNRASSFIAEVEIVAGFELVPMTLRHFDTLRFLGNPILRHSHPSPSELYAFLWFLNPRYTPQDSPERRAMVKRARAFSEPRAPLWSTPTALRIFRLKHLEWLAYYSTVVSACHVFVEEAMYDCSSADSGRREKSYYHDIAYFIDLFGSEYGWSLQATLNLPMKQIFQLEKRCLERRHGRKHLWNRSEANLGALVDSWNRKVESN
jgi:hypothetical protein